MNDGNSSTGEVVDGGGGGGHGNVSAWLPDISVFYKPDLLLIVLYVSILAASLCANTLLIVVVVKFQYMRSVTNIFLVNLSLADLLVTLFCMPVQIVKAVTVLWYFGEVACKVVNFLQGVAVGASVFTITAMSVDRYLAITQSLRQPWMPSRRGALALLLALWAVAIAIFSPLLAVATVDTAYIPLRADTESGPVVHETRVSFCTERWPENMKKELFGTFSFVLVYAVPGSIMVVAYSLMGRRLCSVLPPFDQTESGVGNQQRLRLVRERKRVALILLLLAVLFALCWLPYNILQLLLDMEAMHITCVATLLPYALLLGHANSAINPIVYCLMTRNFRRSLRKLVCADSETVNSSQKYHMQDLRQKSSCMRTRSTFTARSSAPAHNTRSGRASSTGPSVNYAPVDVASAPAGVWQTAKYAPVAGASPSKSYARTDAASGVKYAPIATCPSLCDERTEIIPDVIPKSVDGSPSADFKTFADNPGEFDAPSCDNPAFSNVRGTSAPLGADVKCTSGSYRSSSSISLAPVDISFVSATANVSPGVHSLSNDSMISHNLNRTSATKMLEG